MRGPLTKIEILENELFLNFQQGMLDIYCQIYPVEKIISAWDAGVDKIKEILEEKQNEEMS